MAAMAQANGPTESNPYAWDNDFSTVNYTVSSRTFESILFYSGIFHITTFLLGMLMSLLTLCLILKKTGKMLQNYRMMLIYNCFVDVQMCVSVYLSQYSTKTVDRMIITSFEGPGRLLSFEGQCLVAAFFALSLSVVITSLPANYYFRYDCIKRECPLTGYQLFQLYFIAYVVTFPTTLGDLICFHEDGASRPNFNYGFLWFDIKPLPTIMILDFRLTLTRSFIIYTFVCYGTAYVLAIIYAVKTLRILRNGKGKYSQRTIQIQKQLSLTMLVQSILPIFISVGPSTILIIEIAFGFEWDLITTVAFNSFALIPVLNSLCTIIVIRPFREAILSSIFKRSAVSIPSIS